MAGLTLRSPTTILDNVYEDDVSDSMPIPDSGSSQGFLPSGASSEYTYTYGDNLYFTSDAPADNYIPNGRTDPYGSAQAYDQDSKAFGMAAFVLGPLSRLAQGYSLEDVYGGNWADYGTGDSQVNIRVGLTWDMANKQAEVGSLAWYRNISNNARDLVNPPVMSESTAEAFRDIFARPDPNAAPARKVTDSSQVYSYGTEKAQPTGYSPVKTSVSGVPDWNDPMSSNPIFGISGYNTYDRLAPPSVSRGTGLFSSGIYSTSTRGDTRNYGTGLWF
jgi:hypothetical protein